MKHQLPATVVAALAVHALKLKSSMRECTALHFFITLAKALWFQCDWFLVTWLESHVHSWPGRKLCPDSIWSLNTCSTLGMVRGALPKPPGLRMEKNSFSPHKFWVLLLEVGWLHTKSRDTHACMHTDTHTHTQMPTMISYSSQIDV